jgi:ATP synthase protein I
MTKPEDLPSLEALGSDIQKLRDKVTPPTATEPPGKGLGFALRVGVELMSGAFVGGLVGFFLDKWLNTAPVFLILCFFLGSAGGFLNTVRALANTKGKNSEGEEA